MYFYFVHTARSEFMMGLYIVFLGIVPTAALISFAVWYSRNNAGGINQWSKKASSANPISTYVSSIDCFKSRRPKFASSKIRRKSLIERVLSPSSKKTKPSDVDFRSKPYSVSERIGTLPRDQIRIIKKDLSYTTNQDVIDSSDRIEYRRSILIDESVPAHPGFTLGNNEARNESKRKSPLRTELGIKLAEHIQQINNNMQPKNFKNLKLNTDLKFEHLRESPSGGSSAGTPQTAQSILSNDEPPPTPSMPPALKEPVAFYNKKPPPPPAPLYDKKPPPPPAPPKHLKPKI